MTVAIPVSVPIRNIELTPGVMVTIHDVTWEQFEALVEELGESRSARLAYYDGTLEIMSPLPAHERPNRIISDVVKILLDAEGREWEDFGSTTFRRKKIAGLEPDTCFYIQNAQLVRNCMRAMDLEVYPPPDLAIEADVTSQTTLEAYRVIAVPEVWIYNDRQLKIHLLQNGQYVESTMSPTFPTVPILELIPRLVEQALQDGSSRMLRQFRQQISQGG